MDKNNFIETIKTDEETRAILKQVSYEVGDTIDRKLSEENDKKADIIKHLKESFIQLQEFIENVDSNTKSEVTQLNKKIEDMDANLNDHKKQIEEVPESIKSASMDTTKRIGEFSKDLNKLVTIISKQEDELMHLKKEVGNINMKLDESILLIKSINSYAERLENVESKVNNIENFIKLPWYKNIFKNLK